MILFCWLLMQTVATTDVQLEAGDRPVTLRDGVPLSLIGSDSSPKEFFYLPIKPSKLFIMSDNVLDIDLSCEVTGSPVEKSIQHSHILNISAVELTKEQCQHYHITIKNVAKDSKYTLIVNEDSVILLEYRQIMPGTVSDNRKQVYEIAISQSTFLKVIVRLCQWVPARVALASSLRQLEQQKYEYLYDIPEQESVYVIGYTAKPGVVYFTVLATSLLEYSVVVYPFKDAREEMAATSLELADPFIEVRYLEKDNTIDYNYDLLFEPLKIHGQSQQYLVRYVMFESANRTSLRLMTRCNGFTNTGILQVPLETKEVGTKLNAKYVSNMSSSYATVVARIEPQLPPYVAYEQYHIVELSTALGPLPIQRFIEKLLALIESITAIQDAQTLNFILFLLVFILNMGCVTVCCCLMACHARRIKSTRGSRLPSNEVEATAAKQESTVVFETEEKL